MSIAIYDTANNRVDRSRSNAFYSYVRLKDEEAMQSFKKKLDARIWEIFGYTGLICQIVLDCRIQIWIQISTIQYVTRPNFLEIMPSRNLEQSLL